QNSHRLSPRSLGFYSVAPWESSRRHLRQPVTMPLEDDCISELLMPPDPTFDELIRRVRAGDQQAAAELVRLYEPAIRRAVRFRLVDNRLGAVLDSMDICQSVMASFFVRAAAGQFDLEKPEHLLRLLVTMARNKLASQARRERADRRDYRRVSPADPHAEDIPAAASNPDRQVAARDLLQAVYRRLTADERELV